MSWYHYEDEVFNLFMWQGILPHLKIAKKIIIIINLVALVIFVML